MKRFLWIGCAMAVVWVLVLVVPPAFRWLERVSQESWQRELERNNAEQSRLIEWCRSIGNSPVMEHWAHGWRMVSCVPSGAHIDLNGNVER